MDIKFSNNLFLSVAELNKFKQSLGEKGWKVFAKNLVKQFGIAQTDNNTQFLPTPSGESEVITIRPGIAFDSDMNIIVLKESVNVSVPAAQLTGDLKYWVILRHKTTHFEEGTVNVTDNGALTGVGTDFLSVLRGQPDFPTKIRLESQVNTGDYEVVSVSSATSAIISGSFTAEQGLKYSVVGTFTPGFNPTEENAQIYEYDSFELKVVIAADRENLAMEDGKDFLICSVNYVNTAMQLQDYRVYYMLDKPYIQTLQSMKELSEDKLVSMTMCSVVSLNEKGVMLELQFEHGFKVTGFETQILSSGYRIDIRGISNIYPNENSFIVDGQPIQHLFQGWYLLNKDTMAYSVITDSSANHLFIEELNPDSISSTNVVLIPPFNEIEYQITASANVPSPSIPYAFKFSVDNIHNKCTIPIMWKDEFAEGVGLDIVTISLKYRMVGSGTDKYQLMKFVTSNFESYFEGNVGLTGVLSDSKFDVPIGRMQPVKTSRNYS